MRWRIKPDKEMNRGKADFLSEPIVADDLHRKPNIIVLLADDLGKYEVSAYGATHSLGPSGTC